MTNFGETKKANHNNNKTKKANIKNPCQGRKSNPGPSAPLPYVTSRPQKQLNVSIAFKLTVST